MARKKTTPESDLWEQEFEDIRSHSRERAGREEPFSTESTRNSPAPDWELPDWEFSAGSRAAGTSYEEFMPREKKDRERSRPENLKHRSGGKRRAAAFLLVLVMTATTLLLAATLLFKLTDVRITGDEIPGLAPEQVVELCGYEAGDNLLFLPTKGQEQDLQKQYPYVAKAKITKHFPATVEIQLTLAKNAMVLSLYGGWLAVSEDGKILQTADTVLSTETQVYGLTPYDPVIGERVAFEDETTQQAFYEILTAISAADAFGDFTVLDMTDLSDIRLYYQDRVEFKMGSVLSLTYKVELGIKSLEEGIGPTEQGVLDLSSSGETKRAVFTPGVVQGPSQAASAVGVDPSGGNPAPEPSADPTGEPSGRDDDIPDAPYVQ